jgi:hypothetical protein
MRNARMMMAMAFTQYNDGGTYDITTAINDDVWVDYQSLNFKILSRSLIFPKNTD